MSSSDDQNQDARLEQQLAEVSTLREKCLARSAMRAASETRRTARTEHRLLPLLQANFHIMNLAQSTLEFEVGREAAVQNIALLESADNARNFQGDYDESEYEYTVQWMTACSYDNLATATAHLQGYNSEGMQSCIADGIAVCRRTGKLRCITCFREYATQVFKAADDLPMALHHAQGNASRPPSRQGDDRRFVGAQDESEIYLVTGDYRAAYDAAVRAFELGKTYHNTLIAQRQAKWVMLQAAELARRPDWADAANALNVEPATPDEDASQDWRDDLLKATTAACEGNHASSIEVLTRWDKRLTELNCLDNWFETRLRLVAVYRLAGQLDRATALAKPLEEKAKTAQDYLTLNRLKRLRDDATVPAPVPTLEPVMSQQSHALPVVPPTPEIKPPSDIEPVFDRLAEALQEQLQLETPDVSPITREVLAIPPGRIQSPEDAAKFLHLLAFLSRGELPEADAWRWALAVAAPHARHAGVLSLLASLGDQLRTKEKSTAATTIQLKDLEKLFRQAMDSASDQPGAFARAGLFYLNNDNEGEAERCLARAFRLDRANAFVAIQLSDLFGRTDRATDGLTVLDLCLREGTVDPEVLWKAGLSATSLGKYESALTYLTKLSELEPERRWVEYYRSIALLSLNEYEKANAAIELEALLIKMPTALHVHTIRAAAAAGLHDVAGVRKHIDAAVEPPLGIVNYLSRAGIVGCLTRLWAAAGILPADDPARLRVQDRLLSSGLTPVEFWDEARAGIEKIAELKHYWVDVSQPLDVRWPRSGSAMPGQERWTAYDIRYGVLAADESDAARHALHWQSRSAPIAAEVHAVTQDGGPYTDKPGVTQRGYPEQNQR